MPFKFINIYINRDQKKTLFQQIYEKIRDNILTGKLKPGAKLPATRRLAKELKVSRNVVMEAYDQLHAEGYIESSQGAYTKVAVNSYYERYQSGKKRKQPPQKKPINYDIEFRTGIPDLKTFPKNLWGSYLKKAVLQTNDQELGYYKPEGLFELREILSDYLYRVKGIQVEANQIVITSGATQALSLTAGLLYKDQCQAVIEDPGGYGVIGIFKRAGYGLSTADTGKDGLIPDSIKLMPHTKLIYTTPSHQFPMGSILPAATRIKLLNLIQDKNVFIVEDDYDSEFRYDGPPIHPLKALHPEKVIYLGSFSKVLSPALRIGYAVLPLSMIEDFKQMKRFSDAWSPLISQIALKNFIKDGQFEKHVYKMKKKYQRKRDVLIHTLIEEFGNNIQIFGENAGLHIVVKFHEKTFKYNENFEVCQNGVFIHSLEKHTINKGNHCDKLIFGYGNLSENEIISGIKRLRIGN
ncbi:MAG: PLP-dependent aminotransferase family protein [Desulfobacteraceae bacterium]|nr:PLP-dependent aminotransferase family protein [Desulfobacteraceae bacterium]